MNTTAKALPAILCLLAVLMASAVLWYKAGAARTAYAEPGPDNTEAVKDSRSEGQVSESGKQVTLESLCGQCADKTLKAGYSKYLPDKVFAELLFFGVENKGTQASADVWLDTGEYVVFRGKAYAMSGFAGEAVITYTLPEGELLKIELSEDGEGRDKWVAEHFSKDGLMSRKNLMSRVSYDFKEDFRNKLIDKAEKAFGVPAEREKRLRIDPAKGTWEIAAKSGRTLEKGKLTAGGR